jgi:hypothetical protein
MKYTIVILMLTLLGCSDAAQEVNSRSPGSERVEDILTSKGDNQEIGAPLPKRKYTKEEKIAFKQAKADALVGDSKKVKREKKTLCNQIAKLVCGKKGNDACKVEERNKCHKR